VDQGKVYTKDGQEYGVTSSQVWRGRWWNYYERGSSYAAGEFWFEAIADLQEAIKQRDQDQRRSRTYGLHFVDYFPHREIGVVYYRLGRYADAIRELETSLQSAETAKAKFYLNKARRG
jgi:tetratricopeptide (TPR) repeat protein